MSAPLITSHISPLDLFQQADWLVKTIMVLLALASVATWAIALDKLWRLRRLQTVANGWQRVLHAPDALTPLSQALQAAPRDPFARVHAALALEWHESSVHGLLGDAQQRDSFKGRTERIGDIAIQQEVEVLQAGLPVLATVGSVAPFVGLFGTVWGIMNAFQNIAASNNTSLSVVAPGIAEALFATALGLVAAIPAVIAYNRASGALNRYAGSLQALAGLVAVQVSRSIERGERLPGGDEGAAHAGGAHGGLNAVESATRRDTARAATAARGA